jgi:succinyl-CoA:(S)-malate CoA-transferase subunit A
VASPGDDHDGTPSFLGSGTKRLLSINIFADPHFRERNMILDVPAEGLGTLAQPGVVPKLSLTPGRVDYAGPAMGRHTDEILSGLLGMTRGEIAALRADRVV